MAYQYESLPNEHHIRLLQLSKNTMGVISASLYIADLDSTPEYKCLSYTWGGARYEDSGEEWLTPNKAIELDRSEFLIRQNLYDALDHLLRLGVRGPIWIDAICINQESIPERNSQVAQMARIYGSAEQVLVWLGRAYPGAEAALNIMEKLNASMEESYNATNWDEPASASKARMSVRQMMVADATQAGITKADLKDILQFAASYRWFSRIWTIQEFLLAANLKMLCGNRIVDSQTLYKGSTMLGFAGGLVAREYPEYGKGCEDFKNFWDVAYGLFIDKREGKGWPSMGIQALTLRAMEATDPRDKVFAVSGFSAIERRTLLDPKKKTKVEYGYSIPLDYLKPVEWAFREATISILANHRVETLTYIGDRTRNKIAGLPSWVIDFTRGLEVERFQEWSAKFHAASTVQGQVVFDESGMVLKLLGARIDVIEQVCEAYWEEGSPRGIFEMYDLLANVRKSRHVDDETIQDAFWKTLIADGNAAKHGETEEDLRDGFERWIMCQTVLGMSERSKSEEGNFTKLMATLSSDMRQSGFSDGFELMGMSIVRGYRQMDSNRKLTLCLNGAQEAPDTPANEFIKDLFVRQWGISCRNRLMFRTKRGFLGIGLRNIKAGDFVYLMAEASTPYIFRQGNGVSTNFVTFEGDAYMHGVMYGELSQKAEKQQFSEVIIA